MSLNPTRTKTKAKIVVIIEWVLLVITSGFFLAYVITACVSKESLYTDLECWSGVNVSEYLAQLRQRFAEIEETQLAENPVYQMLIGEDFEQNFWYIVMISVGVIWAVGIVIGLALNILLMNGVKRGDRCKCNLWLTIHVAFFVLGIFVLIPELILTLEGASSFLSFLINFMIMLWLGISIIIIREHRDALGGGQICGCCCGL